MPPEILGKVGEFRLKQWGATHAIERQPLKTWICGSKRIRIKPNWLTLSIKRALNRKLGTSPYSLRAFLFHRLVKCPILWHCAVLSCCEPFACATKGIGCWAGLRWRWKNQNSHFRKAEFCVADCITCVIISLKKTSCCIFIPLIVCYRNSQALELRNVLLITRKPLKILIGQ